MPRVDLIINPVSGAGAGRRAAAIARSVLEQAGWSVVSHETASAGEGSAFAAALDGGSALCVAVGGDGTLNEVISGLTRDVLVGVVPVGTANVVSRDLGIPRDPRRAAQLLCQGTARVLDVGRVNQRRFLAMVGVGFDGEIVEAITRARKGPIGPLTYVAPSVKGLMNFQGRPLRLTVDGVVQPETFYGVTVSNTRNYGGYFSVTPAAIPDDGWFHWVGWTRGSRLALVRYASAAAFKRHVGADAARYGKGRKFLIEDTGGEPVAAQMDGEFLGHTPVAIELLPAAARVVARPGTQP